MTNRLAGIQEFVAVVEAGSFAAAGERLGLSRSAVGKAVARLEARLGARLCHRTTRVLNLTEDGHAFYERCTRALEELASAESALETGRSEPAGRIRVSLPVLFGRRCVVPVLLDLVRQYPRLDIEASFSDRPVDLIEEGYDLTVRNGPVPDGGQLMVRKVASQRMTVCASPAYLDAHGHPATLDDITRHDAIVYSAAGHIKPWRFRNPDGNFHEMAVRSRIKFDDLEAISDATTAGVGLAWLPCWLIREHVRSGKLVPVLQDVEPMIFDSSVLWPQTPHLPSRIRVLIDALATRLPVMTD